MLPYGGGHRKDKWTGIRTDRLTEHSFMTIDTSPAVPTLTPKSMHTNLNCGNSNRCIWRDLIDLAILCFDFSSCSFPPNNLLLGHTLRDFISSPTVCTLSAVIRVVQDILVGVDTESIVEHGHHERGDIVTGQVDITADGEEEA